MNTNRWPRLVCILATTTAALACSQAPDTNTTSATAPTPTPAASVKAESPPAAPAAAPDTVPVTVAAFPRAETDLYFSNAVKDGGFGKFFHHRNVMGIDKQFVVRGNRDTLYSVAVLDLDAGPATVTMPDPQGRFQSLQIIDEDQYVPDVFYGAGQHTLTREDVGTRYVLAAVRTLADVNDPEDLKKATALQDAITVEQASAGSFEVPKWDPVSQKKIRDALLTLSASMPDSKNAFGPRGEVDPVKYLIGSAAAWGGNPEKDALYFNVTPTQNDGKTIYRLKVGEVPVDGFWSISVYNAKGYFEKNPFDAYTLNNVTAKPSADGSIDVQFGGCDGKIPNCLPIAPGWNYLVRLYQPQPQILDGTWKFPEAEPFDG